MSRSPVRPCMRGVRVCRYVLSSPATHAAAAGVCMFCFVSARPSIPWSSPMMMMMMVMMVMVVMMTMQGVGGVGGEVRVNNEGEGEVRG